MHLRRKSPLPRNHRLFARKPVLGPAVQVMTDVTDVFPFAFSSDGIN